MRVGFAPIAWNNEDIADELGPPVPFETVLDEIAASGYVATELGSGFPLDSAVLRSALQARGLTLTSAWCGLALHGDSAEADLAHTRELCQLLSDVGASFVNLAHQGPPERRAFAGRAAEAPRLSNEQCDRLAERVCQAASIAQQYGLQATFHAHVGTFVESRAELDELLRRTSTPLVKLCWDVGHALYGGSDPLEVVRQHPERIGYIHLKDVDGTVLSELRTQRLGFEEGIRRRVFTEVGRGVLDVAALLGALREIGYDGWLMVEQDSTWLAPAASAHASRAYLRQLGV